MVRALLVNLFRSVFPKPACVSLVVSLSLPYLAVDDIRHNAKLVRS